MRSDYVVALPKICFDGGCAYDDERVDCMCHRFQKSLISESMIFDPCWVIGYLSPSTHIFSGNSGI